MTKINLEIDEYVLDEVSDILDNIGLSIDGVIKMCLKRICRENSITFLLPTTSTVNIPTVSTSPNPKITKNKAIRLFLAKGFSVSREVTFASKNKGAYNYWANPNFNVLNYDWSLILNDWINEKIYLFHIPKNTLSINDLTPRGDKARSSLIDLQIMYEDPTFTDNRSGVSFSKFLIDEIDYR